MIIYFVYVHTLLVPLEHSFWQNVAPKSTEDEMFYRSSGTNQLSALEPKIKRTTTVQGVSDNQFKFHVHDCSIGMTHLSYTL